MYVTMYIEMIRKQVYIESRHERVLKERAREYGLTEAELIRRALDRGLGPQPASTPDPHAWKEIRRYIARRRRPVKAAAKRRRWTRDSLYDR